MDRSRIDPVWFYILLPLRGEEGVGTATEMGTARKRAGEKEYYWQSAVAFTMAVKFPSAERCEKGSCLVRCISQASKEMQGSAGVGLYARCRDHHELLIEGKRRGS